MSSKKTNLKFLQGLIIVWLSFGYTYSQNHKIDSLEQLLSADNVSVHEKIDINLKLYLKKQRTDLDTAYTYLLNATKLLKEDKNDSLEVELYRRFSEYHLHKHQYDSTFFYTNRAIEMAENPINKTLIDIYSIKGTTFYYMGEYQNAIENHLIAAKISDTLKLETGTARVLNNIGISYIKLENWVKAEEYMKKSYEICNKYNIQRGMSYTLGNLGIILRSQNKFDEAIDMYRESIKINEELNDLSAISRNHDNLGALYEKNNNYDLAIKHYQKAIGYGEKSNNFSTLSVSHHNMASVYSNIKNYKLAEHHYAKSEELALSLKLKDMLKQIYLGKSVMYEYQSKYDKALLYRKKYEEWKDSIVNSEHLSAISELEIKYKTEKKEKEILALSEQSLKNEAALEKQQVRITRLSFGLIGLLILSGLTFIIFRQYSSNKKQQDLITAIADTQIEERKRIAQDLHDSVGGSLALAKNKLENLLKSKKGEIKEADDFLETLSKTSDQIRQVSHNIMPGELVKFGLVSAVQTTIDKIEDETLKTNLYAHNLEKRIDQTKEIHLFRIIQEIIQNVLKHAKANELSIHLNKFPKHLNLMVEDNGVGFNTDKLSNNGLGLSTIKNRVSYLKGKLNIDSSKGNGTTFNVQIPLK